MTTPVPPFERIQTIQQSTVKSDTQKHKEILEILMVLIAKQEERIGKLESKPELKVENLPYHKTSKSVQA